MNCILNFVIINIAVLTQFVRHYPSFFLIEKLKQDLRLSLFLGLGKTKFDSTFPNNFTLLISDDPIFHRCDFFPLSCPMVMHKWLGGNSHELHNLFMSKEKTGFNHISFYFTVIKSHFSKELYVIKWSKLCLWKGLMFALNAMHFPKVSFCWVPCRSNWLIFYFEEPILNMYGTVGI